MKKIAKALVILMVLSLALTGCSSSSTKTSSSTEPAKKLKVALILPGKKDDVSFNQAMYQGMMQVAKEYSDKIEVKTIENVYQVADIEPALLDFASEGYDVIFGHGFQFMEPIIKVAAKYPKTMFALGTGYKTLDNTCVYDVELDAGGYVMGVMAASMSKNGKVGVIGGADVSEIFRGHEGFKYGAKSVNPNIEIQEVYTGDWTNSAAAKEAAISMYDSGVDIIWHSGDGIGLGVVEAGKEKNKYVLGNVADQNTLAPNTVVSGVVYEWAPIIKNILDDVMNNNFTNRKDKFYWINAANAGLSIAPYHGLEGSVPEDVKKKVEEAYKSLADGSLKLPNFEQKK